MFNKEVDENDPKTFAQYVLLNFDLKNLNSLTAHKDAGQVHVVAWLSKRSQHLNKR